MCGPEQSDMDSLKKGSFAIFKDGIGNNKTCKRDLDSSMLIKCMCSAGSQLACIC